MTSAHEGTTHYPTCWRDPKHHACAVAKVEELEKLAEARLREINQWVDASKDIFAADHMFERHKAEAQRDRLAEACKNAITLMDERGRHNPESNSMMLWNREWVGMRADLFEALADMEADHATE